MSDNWVVQNLQNALDTWNKYLSEIWQLITQSPEQFKGGSIWSVIVNIHDAVRAIGLALGTAIPSRNTATPIPRKICSAASLPPISWRA